MSVPGRMTLAELHARYGVPKPLRNPWRAEPYQAHDGPRVRIGYDLPDYSGTRRPAHRVTVCTMDLAQAREVLKTLAVAIRQARVANDSGPRVPAAGRGRERGPPPVRRAKARMRRPAPEGKQK